MSLSAVIVDDEQLARDELAYLLKGLGDIEVVAQGKTLLMVTHDKEMARQVPRVIEISDGRITRDEVVSQASWAGY